MQMYELQVARILFGYAMARAHTQRTRQNKQLGASAVEWAVIAGIVVTAALAIGVVVNRVINRRKAEIDQG
ncbi:MAG: hypothetical protein ACRDP9_20890 [Kribbellaceae bacterium]|jgi:hypothetical protein|nr:hypothetical protein [Kribbellaceae bacterium]